MVTNPNYKPGVGRLATDRYDFQSHVDGGAFYHKASSIKLDTPITINVTLTNDVQTALTALKIQVDSVGTPADSTAVSKGIIQLAGDIGGTATSVKVTGLRGTPVANLVPTNGQVLKFNSGSGNWEPSTSSTFVTGGDVGGVSGALVVNGLRTIPLDGGSIGDGMGLVYDFGTNSWKYTFMIKYDAGQINYFDSSLNFTTGGININGTSTVSLAGAGTFLNVGSGTIANFNTGSRLNFNENAKLDMVLGATSNLEVKDGLITVNGASNGFIYLLKNQSIIADNGIALGPNNVGSIILNKSTDWISFGGSGRTVIRNFDLVVSNSGNWERNGPNGAISNSLLGASYIENISIDIGSEFNGARLKSIILSTMSYNPTNAAIPTGSSTAVGGLTINYRQVFPMSGSNVDIGSTAVFSYSTSTNFNDLITIDLTASNHIISANNIYYVRLDANSNAARDPHTRFIYKGRITVDQIYNQKI